MRLGHIQGEILLRAHLPSLPSYTKAVIHIIASTPTKHTHIPTTKTPDETLRGNYEEGGRGGKPGGYKYKKRGESRVFNIYIYIYIIGGKAGFLIYIYNRGESRVFNIYIYIYIRR